MKDSIVAFVRFICRWMTSRNENIPPAFHCAFHKKLEQIREQDRIQQEWKTIWNARKQSDNNVRSYCNNDTDNGDW